MTALHDLSGKLVNLYMDKDSPPSSLSRVHSISSSDSDKIPNTSFKTRTKMPSGGCLCGSLKYTFTNDPVGKVRKCQAISLSNIHWHFCCPAMSFDTDSILSRPYVTATSVKSSQAAHLGTTCWFHARACNSPAARPRFSRSNTRLDTKSGSHSVLTAELEFTRSSTESRRRTCFSYLREV